MSDLSHPHDELDELANAYLDGVASSDERARVESDPTLLNRVDALRSVRRSLAVSQPDLPEQRDRAILAALAVFDQLRSGSDPVVAVEPADAASIDAAVPAVVHSLAAARARRARRLAPVLGIAAASVLVLGAGLVALNRGDDTPSSSDSAPAEVATSLNAESAGQDGDLQRKEAPTGGAAETTAAPATIAPVPMVAADTSDIAVAGTEADVLATAALPAVGVEQVWAIIAERQAAATTGDPLPATSAVCPDWVGEPVADVMWEGHVAVVYTMPSLADATVAAVLDAATCDALATFPAAA